MGTSTVNAGISVFKDGETATGFFVIAEGPGILRRVIIGATDTDGLVAIHDNTDGDQGNTIADIDASDPANTGSLEFNCQFKNGLTLEIEENVAVTVVFDGSKGPDA